MTVALLIVALVGVWNVFRFHPALPAGERGLLPRVSVVVGGAALTVAAMALVALFADDLLDWLEITPATARIAVGAVVAVWGLRDLLTAPPEPEPALPGWRASMVPVFFPFLFSPPAGLLALSGSADHDVMTVVVASIVALVPIMVGSAVVHDAETPTARRVERGLHRLLAGFLVLAAFALVIDGVFDI